jgi:hypothetical protein
MAKAKRPLFVLLAIAALLCLAAPSLADTVYEDCHWHPVPGEPIMRRPSNPAECIQKHEEWCSIVLLDKNGVPISTSRPQRKNPGVYETRVVPCPENLRHPYAGDAFSTARQGVSAGESFVVWGTDMGLSETYELWLCNSPPCQSGGVKLGGTVVSKWTLEAEPQYGWVDGVRRTIPTTITSGAKVLVWRALTSCATTFPAPIFVF